MAGLVVGVTVVMAVVGLGTLGNGMDGGAVCVDFVARSSCGGVGCK